MNTNYSRLQCIPQVSEDLSVFPAVLKSHLQPGREAEKYGRADEAVDEGNIMKNDYVPPILSSQEKVDFLRKCCASPILRFILHLLSDRHQDTLCSWYGGPFGVKIWNTRKFTDSYNAAMGTKMNFTNISRALQACEHITMAAVRLWKRLKQGEYSFFPGYTGHGLPHIPLSAMPRDVPAQFPFERKGIIKSPQTWSTEGYGQPVPAHRYNPAPYRTPLSSGSRSHHADFRPYPTPCSIMTPPQLPSPAASVSSQSCGSPEMAYEFPVASPGYLPIPCSILTPPPSDNSSSFSDSFNSSDSCLSQPYSPVFIEPSYQSYETAATANEEPSTTIGREERDTVPHQIDDLSVLSEFLVPLESPPTQSPPRLSPTTAPRPEAVEPYPTPCALIYPQGYSSLGQQDIFGNTSSISCSDLSIDETSLLYH
uniref:ETS domain-containing protein n=1 Tax=Haemonchus contortus TaxID=6289 RepID=A0A7I5E8A0_HAECO